MTLRNVFAVFAIAILAPAACKDSPNAAPATSAAARQAPSAAPTLTKLTLALEGMHCPSCGNRISKVLGAMKGVASARVDFEKKELLVTYDAKQVNPETLMEKVQELGFKSRLLSQS